jgi:hypothetical protein
MPRYYFHLYNDVVAEDEEGQDLPDLAAAREYALRNIRDLMTEEVMKGRLILRHRIEIADEQGKRVLTVPFSEAVTVEA